MQTAIASTSNRAHCELCGGLGGGFRGWRAIHLSPWCLWNSYADRAWILMLRTEGGSLQAVVTFPEIQPREIGLCRVDRLRTNFEMSAICFEVNEESRRMK